VIPLAAVVAFRPGLSSSNVRLWIPVPLFLVWLLALPVLVVALPIFYLACPARRVIPFRALWALLQLLCALRTTRVSIESREASILVHIF
jgi:hypothetical protein